MMNRTVYIPALTLFRPMEFSTKLHTIKSRWSIVYIKGSKVIISKDIIWLSLKIKFVLANSADPDEMPFFLRCFIRFFTVCKRII